MLKLVDVNTYYGESHILHGVSLVLRRGSIVALLGRNGMGKTTTINSIIGLAPPRTGTIEFAGKNIAGLRPYEIAQMGIGLVPQGRRIFPSLSVKENLVMSARSRGNGKSWSLDRVYTLFPILKERAKQRGSLLSGGEQQMLTIARTLMTNATLLLMDEPSEGLAPLILRQLAATIKQLNGSGLTILLAEQNVRMALSIADYVYIISKGAIVYQSTSEELTKNEETLGKELGVER